jgi:hypothetical protein
MSNQTLNPVTQWSPQPVIDWLFSSGCMMKSGAKFVHQLNACGAPLDRLQVTIRTLNPQIVGTSDSWLKSTDVTRRIEPEPSSTPPWPV